MYVRTAPTERPGYWTPRLSAGMIAQVRGIGDPLWSPDGRYIYYPQDYNARTDVFRLDLETGLTMQITSEVEAGGLLKIAQSALDISPDGQQLVYLGAKDGKLWVIPAGGGTAKRLTRQGEGGQYSASFSPDGKRVVFANAAGDHQDIAVADSDGESWPQRVSREDHFIFDPHWLPDSRRVVYGEYNNRHLPFFESRLVLADLTTGEHKTLVSGWEQRVQYAAPRPSPDGRWLAYVSNESGWANIYVLSLESGKSRALAPASVEQGEPSWSPDSSGLVYTVTSHCDTGISYTTLEGQTVVIEEPDGVSGSPAFATDGRRLAYLKQNEVTPNNMYLYDMSNRQKRALTANGVGGLADAGLVRAETVQWTSPDGLEIEGLLYAPPDVQPGQHPMLLHIHGGPIAQYNRRWDGSVQHWVSRGWVVVEPNFRGSTGYGKEFRDKLLGAWGEEDMLDNLGGIEFAQKRGLIDPKRVVAWGGSGGGYATMLLLGKWADQFKAGVALVGVSNLLSMPEQTDRFARHLIDQLLGPRHANFDLHRDRSPVSYAASVKEPMMIIMGAEDRRVPASQGEEMVEALKKAGKTDFEYISYTGEGHGWRKVETILDYHQRMETFLTRWVLER